MCMMYDVWCMMYDMYDVWCLMYDGWCMMYDVWCMMCMSFVLEQGGADTTKRWERSDFAPLFALMIVGDWSVYVIGYVYVCVCVYVCVFMCVCVCVCVRTYVWFFFFIESLIHAQHIHTTHIQHTYTHTNTHRTHNTHSIPAMSAAKGPSIALSHGMRHLLVDFCLILIATCFMYLLKTAHERKTANKQRSSMITMKNNIHSPIQNPIV